MVSEQFSGGPFSSVAYFLGGNYPRGQLSGGQLPSLATVLEL